MTRRWDCTITRWRRITRCLLLVAAIVIVNPDKSFAQLNGQNIKGDTGDILNLEGGVGALKPIQIP